MKRMLQSAILTMALIFGTSATMTIAHSLVAPTVAQAGVLGKIGSAVKKTAVRVGGAAKSVGKGVVHAGRSVGGGIKGVGGKIKQGAFKVGGAIAKSPPAKAMGKVGGAIGGRI